MKKLKGLVFYIRSLILYIRMFFLVKKAQRLERKLQKTQAAIERTTTKAFIMYQDTILKQMGLPYQEDIRG